MAAGDKYMCEGESSENLKLHVASDGEGGDRHLYNTTAPSCCIPASYCHLSATLQNTSTIVVNLQDNRAVFRIFIAL